MCNYACEGALCNLFGPSFCKKIRVKSVWVSLEVMMIWGMVFKSCCLVLFVYISDLLCFHVVALGVPIL